jgi:hypothetical protein
MASYANFTPVSRANLTLSATLKTILKHPPSFLADSLSRYHPPPEEPRQFQLQVSKILQAIKLIVFFIKILDFGYSQICCGDATLFSFVLSLPDCTSHSAGRFSRFFLCGENPRMLAICVTHRVLAPLCSKFMDNGISTEHAPMVYEISFRSCYHEEQYTQ